MTTTLRALLLAAAAALPCAAPASAQGPVREQACRVDEAAEPEPLIEALVARASAYGRKNDSKRAIADLSRALALDGNNLTALKARAEAYYLSSQNERAIQDFNRVIRIAPNDADTFDARGNAFLQS